jgi:lipopolysaccharide transport system permease protein
MSYPQVVTLIEPSQGFALRLQELWRYREVVFFLTWRDVKVRYKQTVLGLAWAIVQPLFAMIVFSIFFGRLAKLPSDGLPYPVFAYVGLIPWIFFANGHTQAAHSLVANANLLKKVYLPRLALPISGLLSCVVDLGCSMLLLAVLLPYYGVGASANIIWVPAFTLLAFGSALGVGIWLAALNVNYRDVRYVLPFMTQLWLFATPIAYSAQPAQLVSPEWRSVYALNPMVGVVEGFRWAVLGRGTPTSDILAASVASTLVLLVSGLWYFRRVERTFADRV